MKREKLFAFTLVELLVVIAIIGILISMMMPAIQAAREAGGRADCTHNMMQLGMGLSAYHRRRGPAAGNDRRAGPDSQRGKRQPYKLAGAESCSCIPEHTHRG